MASILKRSQLRPNHQAAVAGMNLLVLPNVFSPKYFKDTEFFARHLPVVEGETMLEIGPGTGAISICAAKRGARHVLAIDINPDAVRNVRENISLQGVAGVVEVREGDLYKPLAPGETFDKIFWNTPFGLVSEAQKLSALERAVFDPGYDATRRFIIEGPKYLNQGGVMLIGFSTTLGKLELLKTFVEEGNMDLQLLVEEESQEVHPVKFELFEGKPRR